MGLEISQQEIYVQQNLSEGDLVESFETWIYGSGTKAPMSGMELLLVLVTRPFSKFLYNRILEAIEQWRFSQSHEANRRRDPENIEDIEMACSYFLGELDT